MSPVANAAAPPCWILLAPTSDEHTQTRTTKEQGEFQKELESSDMSRKINAMKRILRLVTNGVQMPNLLMTVIRFCMMTDDHTLKKLLLLYWESVPKTDEQGTLRPEMVLVINGLLSDLNHPNEYLRGATLRFLCRVSHQGLVGHLIEPIKNNLTFRHTYVRRQAALAMATIRKRFGEDLIPDAEELLENQLTAETDPATRRVIFLALIQVDQARALRFFTERHEQSAKYGDGYSLATLELARRVCRADPAQKARFIKAVISLLQADSLAVVFEAATTLLTLSSVPTAVRAVCASLTSVLHLDSDNNVKLVVLDKLATIQKSHPKVLAESLMDMLRALNSPSSDIRRKTLDIAMELVTRSNVDEVVLVLKKEVIKTQAKDIDRQEAVEYRRMLVQSIHACAVKFPAVAASVVNVLMDFLNGEGAFDVVVFVRELIENQPSMRDEVVSKLALSLSEIRASNVARAALWVLGEYASGATADQAVESIEDALGPLPFQAEPVANPAAAPGAAPATSSRPATEITTTVMVLPDGTYATQTALSESRRVEDNDLLSQVSTLRRLILEQGDFFLGAVAVVALTKLALKQTASGVDPKGAKALSIRVALVACGLLRTSEASSPSKRIDADSKARVESCLRVLLDPESRSMLAPLLMGETRIVFSQALTARKIELEAQRRLKEAQLKSMPFEMVSFRQLKASGSNSASARAAGAVEDGDDDAQIALVVKGVVQASAASSKFVRSSNNPISSNNQIFVSGAHNTTGSPDDAAGTTKRAKNVYALTGSTDPVYVEATVVLHDYDIVIDFLVINRTDLTLTNVELELCVVGDLKITDRLLPFTMAPRDYRALSTNIKVSSTETGHIFGAISFDHPQQTTTTVISLQEIYIDIMQYIVPATCSDSEFRAMWAEFEWENKVTVFTVIPDCRAYLKHIQKLTNMNCLTTDVSIDGDDGQFVSANLFASSIFGEAALLNLSIEKSASGKVEGNIRLRSKSQGIALSLGDRITMKQKGDKE